MVNLRGHVIIGGSRVTSFIRDACTWCCILQHAPVPTLCQSSVNPVAVVNTPATCWLLCCHAYKALWTHCLRVTRKARTSTLVSSAVLVHSLLLVRSGQCTPPLAGAHTSTVLCIRIQLIHNPTASCRCYSGMCVHAVQGLCAGWCRCIATSRQVSPGGMSAAAAALRLQALPPPAAPRPWPASAAPPAT